jgi:hypothetical protein
MIVYGWCADASKCRSLPGTTCSGRKRNRQVCWWKPGLYTRAGVVGTKRNWHVWTISMAYKFDFSFLVTPLLNPTTRRMDNLRERHQPKVQDGSAQYSPPFLTLNNLTSRLNKKTRTPTQSRIAIRCLAEDLIVGTSSDRMRTDAASRPSGRAVSENRNDRALVWTHKVRQQPVSPTRTDC